MTRFRYRIVRRLEEKSMRKLQQIRAQFVFKLSRKRSIIIKLANALIRVYDIRVSDENRMKDIISSLKKLAFSHFLAVDGVGTSSHSRVRLFDFF